MSAGEIDKQQLYGRYQKSEDDRHALAMKLYHKSLDIPLQDDVNVTNANQTSNGLDWRGLAVVVAGLLGLGSMGAYMMRPPQTPAATPPAASSAEGTARVRVYWGEEEIKPGESRTAVGP